MIGDLGHGFHRLFGVALLVFHVLTRLVGQPSSLTSDIMNNCQDALPFLWTRPCALCKALLTKPRLWNSVRCQCGWEWEGRGEDQGEDRGEDQGRIIEFCPSTASTMPTKKSA